MPRPAADAGPRAAADRRRRRVVIHAKGVYYEWVRTVDAALAFERTPTASPAARLRLAAGPATRSDARARCYHRAMLDHEEKFLFKEEILHLSNAVAEPGILDNVEDLLTDVITSPRFDSEVFTLERSLQVMLGPRAGTTLVGLLTVAPEVFDEVAEVRIPSEVHERLVAWRAPASAWPSTTP